MQINVLTYVYSHESITMLKEMHIHMHIHITQKFPCALDNPSFLPLLGFSASHSQLRESSHPTCAPVS